MMARKVLLIITILGTGLVVVPGVSAAGNPSGPVFNDTAQTVTWTTPATCRHGAVTPCNFLLYVNEPSPPNPKSATVGSVQGGVGTTLTIDYPSFCGTIQADVFFQVYNPSQFRWAGKNWSYAVAESNAADRHVIETCPPG